MSTGRMFCRAAMPERTMRRCLFSFFQKVRRTSVNGVIPYLREMNFVSVMFRLILAMVCGGMIGLERGRKRRPAGFRTYMLVCLGAALTMLLSQYEFAMVMGPWKGIAQELGMKTDVSRFGAQVINGIGFLGAGTILVTGRQEVKGLTTAAGLWASACMGLAIGAGFYECVVKFKNKPSKEVMIERWNSFKGRAQELKLPSAPEHYLTYCEEDNRPQTKLDRMTENGMGVTIGRLREDTIFDYKFVSLSHNTLRGAAGGAVLMAELLCAEGYMDR